MTYVLVGLMFLNGQLQYHFSPQESRNACEQAALAAKATNPTATVQCMAVLGQPA
jgi:hypothetical protein